LNNKILIGSIIATAILIGVSFTSVVGYRSVESDVKASLLFYIRSSRAIDEESEELSCAYVGKGDESNLLIPKRDDENNLFQNYIEIIQLMSDGTFNRFVGLIIKYLKKSYTTDDKNINGLVNSLRQLKYDSHTLSKSHIVDEKDIITMSDEECITIFGNFCFTIFKDRFCLTVFFDMPICIPGNIIGVIMAAVILMVIVFLLLEDFWTNGQTYCQIICFFTIGENC